MIAIVRSLAFYAIFYLGSVFYVLAAAGCAKIDAGLLRRVVGGWSRWHRGCARWLLGIQPRVAGTIPGGGYLYALKHESFYEAIDLPALFDTPAAFAKAELFAIPGWGTAALAYGMIPVARDQGARTLRAMIASGRTFAAEGRPLVIFPEGTRVPHGEPGELQAGFAGLYKLLGLPVIPVAVDSGPLYHRRWKRAGTMTYRFGEPIEAGLPREEIEARVQAALN